MEKFVPSLQVEEVVVDFSSPVGKSLENRFRFAVVPIVSACAIRYNQC